LAFSIRQRKVKFTAPFGDHVVCPTVKKLTNIMINNAEHTSLPEQRSSREKSTVYSMSCTDMYLIGVEEKHKTAVPIPCNFLQNGQVYSLGTLLACGKDFHK
jgi:hypothetical protein